MKNSIKLAALLLLVSTGLFAATPDKNTDATKNDITVEASPKDLVVGIRIQKEATGRAFVKFYDNDANEVMTDYLPHNEMVAKAYNLSELPVGTYTMSVTSNHKVVTKQFHVYKESGKKSYVFVQ